LDPSRIKGNTAKVRCSSCGHVFTISRPDEQEFEPDSEPVVSEDAALDHDVAVAFAKAKKKQRLKASRPKSWLLKALFGVIVLVVIGAGAYLYMGKEQVQKKETGGTASTEDPFSKNITLSSAEGYFKENEKEGTLFVIKGLAQNKNNRYVSFITLKGMLHDTEAKKVKEQEVFAGNLFTDKELSTLTMAEIRKKMSNRYGLENADYQIAPGGTVSYMIVFDKIPDNLAEFTVKVVGSQADTTPPK